MPETPIQRLQGLLREMFQFDSADLDFGIYRLLHLKRREIEAFLSEQLPRQVDEAFASVAGQERAALQGEVEALAEQIKEQIAPDALSPTGEVREQYRASTIKVVKGLVDAYEEKRRRLQAAEATEARQAEVFNHLYNFFARYYEDGDFIPRYRYGAAESYAVPYDGQEVFFHWATRDMHYVKTAETLKDYAFTVEALGGPYRLRFVLVEASVPKDNVKGERRFFFPRPDLAAFDEAAREFHLPFEYRPPTEKEADKYGVNAKAQEAISAEAVEPILEAVGDETLRATLAADQRTEQEKADDKPELPLILKRLRHFTKKQTSDFFIHKDLRGFLRRELEFYIKDQVLNLADIEGDFDAKRRMIRVLRRLGEDLIEFLSQIEDAQKRLFEKKKFIIETQYCITVGNIPEEFYGEIAACDTQWAEWRDLFHIDEEEKTLFNSRARTKKARRVAFLKAHPTLVLDTKHFDRDFVDRLLASFDDLDEITDGLLVHGENYQALNLLLEKYRGRVRCTYIDPPFNTDDSQFSFKDTYRNATWVSLLSERLGAGVAFLTADGTTYVHLDHNSNFYGRLILDGTFGRQCLLNEVVWRIGWVSGYKTDADRYVRNHETIFVYGRHPQPYFDKDKARIPYKAFDQKTISGPVDEIKRVWGLGGVSPLRLKLVFKDSSNSVYKIGLTAKDGAYNIEDTWNCNEYEDLHSNKIKRNAAEYTPRGSEITQKPEQLLRRVIEVSSKRNDIVLDYFAGSGTTPAVAKKLERRFVAVEMGTYFDSDMLWRMKQVLFGRQVGISKQVGHEGGGMFKYIRLESYEDALHNLAADGTQERAREREGAVKEVVGEDEYRLKYLVRLPLEATGAPVRLHPGNPDRPRSAAAGGGPGRNLQLPVRPARAATGHVDQSE